MENKFAELGLNEHILAGVEALGFTEPTPVQAQSIPQVLAGRDVIASAQTGTGKTAAFALPILQVIADRSRQAREDQAALVAQDQAKDKSKAGARTGEGAPGEPEDQPQGPADEAKKDDGIAPAPSAGDVLADDAAGDPSLSAKVNPDGSISAGPGRRTRRRHHRKAAAPASAEKDASSAGKPPASRRRGGSAAGRAGGKPDDRSASPRSRRRRRNNPRKPHDAGIPADRQSNPNAHPFGPFALVVTPTRELASQIEDVVSVVCEHTGQKAVVVMGGAKFDRQIRELEAGCDLLVATPGRLLDLIEHDHVSLKDVQCLVLDEADRMLDMGFWPSVRRIVAACPKDRQTLLFSATIPPSIKGTVDAMLKDPVTIEIARIGQTADTVEEHLCPVTQGQKTQLLRELLATGGADGHLPERVLVFTRTKHRADELEAFLKKAQVKVDVMHSDRPQKARERALEKFREGKVQVLVATDVMSRGIDVSGIDAVVNYDVPMDPEDYVHRIGRTGRAGATGHAYTFVAPDEITPLREIEYFTKKLVPVWDLPGFVYDEGRIVPNATRATTRSTRKLFSGSRSRGRGISAGRYGRHY